MFNVTGKRSGLEALKFIDTIIERISPRVSYMYFSKSKRISPRVPLNLLYDKCLRVSGSEFHSFALLYFMDF